MSAPDHKAIAISPLQGAFITDQKDDEAAKAAALEACHRATEPLNPNARCDIYAVGNDVIYARGRPPMPPEPWFVHDASIETPFAIEAVPLAGNLFRTNLQKLYLNGRKPKAFAVSPQGPGGIFVGQSSQEEAVRRALELCGSRAGVACVTVAVDDAFVVPIPATMKVVGLFRAASNPAIAPEARDDIAHRLGNATGGWSAVAVGASGRSGTGAAGRQRAKRDRRRAHGLQPPRPRLPGGGDRAVHGRAEVVPFCESIVLVKMMAGLAHQASTATR
jgi:adenylate cyclase